MKPCIHNFYVIKNAEIHNISCKSGGLAMMASMWPSQLTKFQREPNTHWIPINPWCFVFWPDRFGFDRNIIMYATGLPNTDRSMPITDCSTVRMWNLTESVRWLLSRNIWYFVSKCTTTIKVYHQLDLLISNIGATSLGNFPQIHNIHADNSNFATPFRGYFLWLNVRELVTSFFLLLGT